MLGCPAHNGEQRAAGQTHFGPWHSPNLHPLPPHPHPTPRTTPHTTCPRTHPDVLRPHALVKGQRLVEALHKRVGGAGETPAPQLLLLRGRRGSLQATRRQPGWPQLASSCVCDEPTAAAAAGQGAGAAHPPSSPGASWLAQPPAAQQKIMGNGPWLHPGPGGQQQEVETHAGITLAVANARRGAWGCASRAWQLLLLIPVVVMAAMGPETRHGRALGLLHCHWCLPAVWKASSSCY